MMWQKYQANVEFCYVEPIMPGRMFFLITTIMYLVATGTWEIWYRLTWVNRAIWFQYWMKWGDLLGSPAIKPQLIDMAHDWLTSAKQLIIFIFNGRLGHDHGLGEFTRDDTTGRSVVDYAIGSPVIFNQVNFFKVLDKVPESDHRPLSISLSINYHCHNDKQIEEPEWQVTHKYIWHRDSLSQLPRIMCDERSQLFHDDLCDSISNLCNIDIVAGKLDLYISQACERAFSRTSCVRKNKKRTGLVWFWASFKAITCYKGRGACN